MTSGNKAIIIFGPPGAGKGVQARLIAGRLGYINFDTGRIIERIVYNPALRKSPIIQRERKKFETGKLCTPSWVLPILKRAISKIGKVDMGVVLSASPRTLYEAFGDNRTGGLMQLLQRVYGKENVLIFEITISPKESILRNSHRKVCSVCDTQILRFNSNLKKCPFCGGLLRKRSLDKPEIIKVRIKEYKERTEPIFKGLKKRGFNIHVINGRPLPAQIFRNLEKFIDKIR